MWTRSTFAMVGILIGVYAFFFSFQGRSHANVAIVSLLYGVPIGGFVGYIVGIIAELTSKKYKLRGL